MVKVNTLTIVSTPTKTFVFINFLIRSCFFPITVEEGDREISFKWISRKTLSHLLFYCVSYILILSCLLYSLFDYEFMMKILEKNTLETLSINCCLIGQIALLFPLILAKGWFRKIKNKP